MYDFFAVNALMNYDNSVTYLVLSHICISFHEHEF